MRKFHVTRAGVCTFVLAVSCAAQEHHPEHTWDYGDALGPSHWGDLKLGFAPCKNGHHQSPIDICHPKKAALPPIQFDYKPSPLHSEEKINGKGFDMTVHLVHVDDDGKVAVVAVLLQAGEDSPLVHELWNDLPKEKDKEEFYDNVQINLSQILPPDRGYYTFSGSLTTPPCSEDVTWFVLKHPTTISAEEIQRFSQLYHDDTRATQPLYDRIVLENQ